MENENQGFKQIVAQQQDIEYRSFCFGIFKTLYYKPTNSRLKFYEKYYAPSLYNDLLGLLSMSEEAIIKHAEKNGCYEERLNGNLLVELCLSADHQVAAILLSQYKGLKYHPISDVRVFTSHSAEAIAKLFVK